MTSPKLLQILEKLPLKEVKKFRAYFKKNYPKRNIHQEVLDNLIKAHPYFGINAEELKELYGKVFPKYFVGKRFSNELGKLIAPLEEFLLLQKLRKNNYEKNLLLSSIFQQYGIRELYFKNLEELEKDLKQEDTKDLWYWLHKMQLAHKKHFNPYTNHQICGPENVKTAKANLVFFWSAAQLRYTSELYNRHTLLQEDSPDLSQVKKLNFPGDSSEFLYHQSYDLGLKLMQSEDDESYYALKKKFIPQLGKFKQRDQYILTTYLLNYVAKKIRGGHQSFLQEQFKIIEITVPHGVFVSDGIYDNHHFINTVNTACQLKKLVWVEAFIEKWSPYIKEELKDETKILAKAILLFHQKEFEEVISLMNTFRSQLVQHEIRGRFLRLMSHYELKHEMEDHLKSYRKYIERRKDLSESLKKGAFAVSKFIAQFQKTNPNKKKLLNDLESAPNIYLKKWLQEKINEIK